jgi:hypothetical protein
MTVTEEMLTALRVAEQCIDSQMSLMPGQPPIPYWKVLEIVRNAIKRGENLSLRDLDEELEQFP